MRSLFGVIGRALGGMGRDPRRALATVAALLAVFLVLGTFIVAVANLGRVLGRWSEDLVVTAYLKPGASQADVAHLTAALRQSPDVADVRYVPPDQARADLEKGLGRDAAIARDLDPALFPGYMEIRLLGAHLDPRRLEALASRLGKIDAVDEVVTYRSWYQKLASFVRLLRGVCIFFGVLVGGMTLTVIATTIRLALLRNQREFEIMKLCGATNRFITTPLVIEGALLATLAMGGAIGLVHLVTARFGALGSELLPLLRVESFSFLPATAVIGLLAASAAVGAVGSEWAVRRHLKV